MADVPEGSRMGWEVELHNIKISWKRQTDDVFWPTSQARFDTWGPTMAPDGTSIFIPADLGADLDSKTPPTPTNVAAFGDEDNINWTGQWGFRVVQDAAAPANDARGECIAEVNTSAQLISDYSFWFWAQTCLRELRHAMTQFASKPDGSTKGPTPTWRRAQELLDHYNNRIRALPKREDVEDHRQWFGLQLSRRLKNFNAGTPGPVAGIDGNPIPDVELANIPWETCFAVGLPTSVHDMCDVQVNYSVKLGWLSQNLATWIACWGGMWTHQLLPSWPKMDPDVGDLASSQDHFPPSVPFQKKFTNPKIELYRTQLYAAAWRTAEASAAQLLTTHVNHAYGQLGDMDRKLIKGLMICLLTVGAVTVTRGSSSSKNCTPQLFKSSPAAIGRLIRARGPATAAVMTTLAGDAVAAAAHTVVTNKIRDMNVLQQAPGNLPAGRPQTSETSLDTYPAYPQPSNMYKGTEPPGFEDMWKSAFNPPAQPAGQPVNTNYGLTPHAPFNCSWAKGIQTGISPVVQTHADNDILIGFESRYSACILNIGFNPKVARALFTKSYLSLVAALAPARLNAATELMGEQFGWAAVGNPTLLIPVSLERDLTKGIH